MPIKIPDALPARETLEKEHIFVMTENRAIKQDIRPLKIAILNLMPTKITTETQLLRVLGNSPLQSEVDLIMTASHISKNTPNEHLLAFYKTFDEIKDNKYDGFIITGAPVETIDFEDVDYWSELVQIMEWSKTNVFSTFHICWGAQAGLYYHYGIGKYQLGNKKFGIFKHNVMDPFCPLLRGFDDYFYAPHSRHTEILAADVEKVPDLKILSYSEEAGVYIVINANERQIFVTGHSEYDADTLSKEYFRDADKGVEIDLPAHYFPGNDPSRLPIVCWRAHANLLFMNWLNYYVYQTTPYDLNEIK